MAHGAHGRAKAPRLDVAENLTQAAVLVEVAAHEGERRVMVRMQHSCARVKDLRQPCLDQLTAEQLILGVRHVPERDTLPCPACQAAVDAREKRVSPRVGAVGRQPGSRPLQPLNVDSRAATPSLEVLLELSCDHVWSVGPRNMWPEDSRDIRRLLESLEERREPAIVGRRRILSQEGDVVALRKSHDEVARVTVRELGPGNLVEHRAKALGDVDRAVRGSGVDHEDLDIPMQGLRANRREHFLQVPSAVEYGNADCDQPAHGARSFLQASRVRSPKRSAALFASRSGAVTRHESDCSISRILAL